MTDSEQEYYEDLIKFLEKQLPFQDTYSERVDIRNLIRETKKKLDQLKDLSGLVYGKTK